MVARRYPYSHPKVEAVVYQADRRCTVVRILGFDGRRVDGWCELSRDAIDCPDSDLRPGLVLVRPNRRDARRWRPVPAATPSRARQRRLRIRARALLRALAENAADAG